MASDICVTLGDGSVRDCLRKSYPVGRFIIAGFAGSVRIGFTLLDDLLDYLRMPEEDADKCWDPAGVAADWAADAAAIFAAQPEHQRKLGSEILLLGIDPDDRAIRGGVPVLSVLRAPTFVPDTQRGGGKVMAIGSGVNQTEVMERLRKAIRDPRLMQTEVMNSGGFGRTIADDVTYCLFQGAPKGVSRHLHVSLAGLDQGSVHPNNLITLSEDGEPETVLQMPPVAESWAQLCQMLNLDPSEASSISALNA